MFIGSRQKLRKNNITITITITFTCMYHLRSANTTLGTALNEATCANTILHIIGIARAAHHLIAAQSLTGTGTNFGGRNAAQVAATAGDFAALFSFFIGHASTSTALGGHRHAASMTNAAAVAGTLATTFNVFTITGRVATAGGVVHASSTITHDYCIFT